jgi:tRNA dimethylallyltransferase
MHNQQIIVIAGPTASGKSQLALQIAKRINGVIINGDSRQIYKEMNIGTAKPIPDEVKNGIWYIQGVPHYLYSFVSISTRYTVYNYQKDVYSLFKTLPKEKIPIITGGTGLYIDSVFFHYNLKKEFISNKYASYSLDELKEILGEDELEKLNESDRENPRRLLRILQKRNSGIPIINKNLQNTTTDNGLYFVLDLPKEILQERIRIRVEKMFEDGLKEENEQLRKLFSKDLPAFQTIGYKEFDDYFDGEKDLETVKTDIIKHTNQYAKRQRTWFRRNKNAIWIDKYSDIEKLLL